MHPKDFSFDHQPVVLLEVVESEGDGVYWEEVKSIGMCP
jgi:hypothetical protein